MSEVAVINYQGIVSAINNPNFASGVTLLISSPILIALSTNDVIPPHIVLRFTGGGKFEVTSGLLTILGPILAPNKQIFDVHQSASPIGIQFGNGPTFNSTIESFP